MKKVILSIFVAVALVACSTETTDCAKDCTDSTAVVATDSVAPSAVVVVADSTAPVAPVEAVK